MSYTIDFRRKVISVRKAEGLTIRETAKQFRIGKASLVRWLKRPEPKNSTPRKRKLDKNALAKDVEQYPDAYQKERAERFGVCKKTIWQSLKKLGLTYKKNSIPSKNQRKRQAGTSAKKTTVRKKKINLLFLLMKVVFHMTLHELTAIPQKVTVVLA
ncbi:IS630 transposase-related protein [Candidatus Arsenophonus triatominarum]|uniref:IS630 transposase-related protein n=1 Tax=Candidatus Arsenophonus triatominarum TaxID=57911 RepID=UPI0007C44F4E|nr:IS630 transposase-related protein [Candidatus Arsenophonus triatominarum]